MKLLAEGDLPGAEREARIAVEEDPRRAEAHNALGNVLVKREDFAGAESAYRAAVEVDPELYKPWQNLGNLARRAGQLELAVERYEHAIALEPNAHNARASLGSTLASLGRSSEAILALELAASHAPSRRVWAELAHLLEIGGRIREAADALEHARTCGPPDFVLELGRAELLLRLDEATEARRALERISPLAAGADVKSRRRFGVTLKRAGMFREAVQELEHCLAAPAGELSPLLRARTLCLAFEARLASSDDDGAWAGFERALSEAHADLVIDAAGRVFASGDRSRLCDAVRRAVVRTPDRGDLVTAFAHLLTDQGRYVEAESFLRSAVARRPDDATLASCLAVLLTVTCRHDEALVFQEAAVAQAPSNPRLGSDWLLMLHYSEASPRQRIFDESRAWGRRHASSTAAALPRPPSRQRLRIGYISSDFGRHSVGRLVAPLVTGHDRSRFEVFAYMTGFADDALTTHVSRHVEHFRRVPELSDAALLALLRDDRLDALIELNGHTGRPCLRVLGKRAAFVQATYLGYPDTTGVESIDYRITDGWADPEGADRFSVETLLRMPRSAWCFSPGPLPTPSRPDASMGIVFGSFNNVAKLTPEVVDSWTRILLRVPKSRLVLKAASFVHEEARDTWRQIFRQTGLSDDRVDILEFEDDSLDHLARYRSIDVALDPFPYNGTMTTCEALAMGVPVVSLIGERHASRVGLSLLRAAGLAELATPSLAAYEDLAVALAEDQARLAEVTERLQNQGRESELFDVDGFIRAFEDTVVEMVQRGPRGDEASRRDALDLAWRSLALAGRVDEAWPHFERALHEGDLWKTVEGVDLLQEPTGSTRVADLLARHYQANPSADAAVALAHHLLRTERLVAADLLLRSAREQYPADPRLVSIHGLVASAAGRPDEGVELQRRAVKLAPTSLPLRSNLLLSLQYSDEDPATIFEEHLEFGRSLAPSTPIPARRDPTPLRVGFISGDLRRHSVGRLLVAFFSLHDRSRFALFAYRTRPESDDVTAHVASTETVMRDVWDMTDDGLAELVARDRIDVLVDLAGHTAGGRLAAMARRLAPVQVSYLGYPDTTGVPAMDYRIVDWSTDPEGAEARATERLFRLDRAAWCFAPGMLPSTPPLDPSRPTRFGSFNNLAKVGPRVVEAWSRILTRVPSSSLVLKAKTFSSAEDTVVWRDRFESRGIDPARLSLLPFEDQDADHLGRYGDVDIALDTFPYNGTMTTCEALAMGVPVVTLVGTRHVSRVGSSLVRSVGLDELAAHSVDEYVEVAVGLGKDRDRLAGVRGDLARRFEDSSLYDAEGFTRELERAFLEMCRSGPRREP